MMMGEGDRIEFADRGIAAQDAARIFPGHRRAGLDLRPRDLARHTTTIAAFGDEVVDAADAVLVARIPILYGRILDLGAIQRAQFADRSEERRVGKRGVGEVGVGWCGCSKKKNKK